MKNSHITIIVLVIIGATLLFNSMFVVDEREQVVVTRFGKISRAPVVEAGLNFKVPFIDIANYFPRHLLEWDGSPGQIPTRDKTFIWVDAFARWRIVDPVAFFQTVATVPLAINRLDDIIDPAIRNLITAYGLTETVRNTNRPLDTLRLEDQLRYDFSIELGRKTMTEDVRRQAQPRLERFGIELADVKFKRINYVREVRESVYARMIAERNQMAEQYRSEGRGEASKIRGDKERDLKEIASEAYKTTQAIKGEADAKALKIYADAYQRDPDFYSFVKTLEIYESSLDRSSDLVISTDSEFFRYLDGYQDRR